MSILIALNRFDCREEMCFVVLGSTMSECMSVGYVIHFLSGCAVMVLSGYKRCLSQFIQVWRASKQWFITLDLKGHCPAGFPALPVIHTADYLGQICSAYQKLKGQGQRGNKQDSFRGHHQLKNRGASPVTVYFCRMKNVTLQSL